MLTVGTYLADRYEIVSKIGAGGMSDVYKAKDHVLGRFVAIKVLKPEFSEDRGFVAKFRTEAQSAAGLEHPNIVNIYDVGSEEGLHYIVMEYVEGITLKTYIEKKGQLSFKEAVSIAIQVARGIEAAHNKQIIHRDIKPQNIMISTEGKVKVMDFGIARAASSNTVSSDVMGSVHYSSPEQARNGFVDGRSDIYSLGIVMYEMVTGRVPFDGDTTVAVAIQHLQEEMTPPSVYAKNLPISMEKIILKCTQKNADRRYQTIGDLLADLRRSLVHPDEDFVVIAPLVDNGKTKVISGEELKQIKEHGGEPKEDRHASKLESSYDPDEDEDDEDEVEERRSPLLPILFAVASVFVIMTAWLIFTIVSGNLGTESGGSDEMTMPNIVGMMLDDVKTKYPELNLDIDRQYSTEYKENEVMDQKTPAGRTIKKSTIVNIVISNGPQKVEIDDYSNLTVQDAQIKLEKKGLKPKIVYVNNDDVAKDIVIKTEPAAHSEVSQGTLVKVYAREGSQCSQVYRYDN